MNIFEILLVLFLVWVVFTKILPYIRSLSSNRNGREEGPIIRNRKEPSASTHKPKERIDRSQIQDAEFKDVE